MRIVRFIDDKNQICYGQNYNNDAADLLEGDLFAGLEATGRSCRVKKLLAPLLPPAVLGIGFVHGQFQTKVNQPVAHG